MNILKKIGITVIVLSSAVSAGCANMGGSAFPSQTDRIEVVRPDGTTIKAQGRGVDSADIYIEDTHNRNGSTNRSTGSAKDRVCQEEEFKNHPSCQGQ